MKHLSPSLHLRVTKLVFHDVVFPRERQGQLLCQGADVSRVLALRVPWVSVERSAAVKVLGV